MDTIKKEYAPKKGICDIEQHINILPVVRALSKTFS